MMDRRTIVGSRRLVRGGLRAARSGVITARDTVQRMSYRRRMSPLDDRQRAIVEALEREGATAVSVADLPIPGTDAMLADGQRAFDALLDRERAVAGKSYLKGVPHSVIQELPALWGWGLSDWLLDLVEYYLARPPFYRGVIARRDLADDQAIETRLFHRDNEDVRSVKVIVYLSEVTAGHGPHEYVPKPLNPSMTDLAFRDGRVPDEEMRRHVPEERWVQCTGSAGTAVIADTCSIFHRGRVPLEGHRDALFFAYNSRRPLSVEMAGPIFEMSSLCERPPLSPRQRAALSLDV